MMNSAEPRMDANCRESGSPARTHFGFTPCHADMRKCTPLHTLPKGRQMVLARQHAEFVSGIVRKIQAAGVEVTCFQRLSAQARMNQRGRACRFFALAPLHAATR